MNTMRDLARIVRNASRAGHYRRDQSGNEHDISGYVVKLSYEKKVKGGGIINVYETAVIVTVNSLDAKRIAVRPYRADANATVISCEDVGLGNPTVLRITEPEKALATEKKAE